MTTVPRFVISAAALLSAIAGAGCATKPRCPDGVKDVYCSSMKDTYDAARAGAGNDHNVLGRPEGDASGKGAAGRVDIPSGRHNLAGPVYTQAKPYRIWVAPWTDANGIVHSGEYMYFTTPGYWNYGPMEMPGSASGVLGPALPENLGFVPTARTTPNATNPQAGTVNSNGAGGQRAPSSFPGSELPANAFGSGDRTTSQPVDPDPNDPDSITRPAVRMKGTAGDVPTGR